jgi:hypothetical protein
VRPRPVEELYDLEADPHELHNLAGDPRYAQELAELRQLLAQWEHHTGDLDRSGKLSPDEFDRETGEPLPNRVRPRPTKTQSGS